MAAGFVTAVHPPDVLQALVNNRSTSAALGFSWDSYDDSHTRLSQRYGDRWWQTGPRRCWDEVAVLSRMRAKDREEGSLADVLNDVFVLRCPAARLSACSSACVHTP